MKRTGFQALHFGQAVEEINRMLQCRDQPLGEINEYIDEKFKPRSNCTIFLGYTSNMASGGAQVGGCVGQHRWWYRRGLHQMFGTNVFGGFQAEGLHLAWSGLESDWQLDRSQ